MGNHLTSMNNDMKMYRLRLKPNGSFQTRWSSDTLTGALFWAYYRREGEEALAKLLQEYRFGNPSFVLSSGFPGNLLPKPFLPPLRKDEKTTLAQLRLYKKIKKIEWVTLDDFNRLLMGEQIMHQDLEQPLLTEIVMHNEVNRITGTTGDNHSLFAAEEIYLNDKYEFITIYAFIKKNWQSRLKALFEDLGREGIGGRSSTGKGTFFVAACDEFEFNAEERLNGYIQLGNAVPKASDPSQGYFKIDVKRGRLGEEKAKSGSPFKKPLLMLKPGSVFYEDSDLKWIGRLVDGIAISFPEAVQCGMAMVIPALLPEKHEEIPEVQ